MSDVGEELAALRERVEALETRGAIIEVLYRYGRGADRCDIELLKSCYWPEARDEHWFFNGSGHEFCDYVVPLLQQIPHSQHSITNPIIEIEGDRAFVECQWDVLHRIRTGDGRFIDQRAEGRYLDIFERRNGEWKILRRQLAMEGFREHVTPDTTMEGAPGVGQRAPHDPSYLGLGLIDADFFPYDGEGLHLWDDARSRFP